ncbi:hypothetical protein FOA52_012354 [Chlamydomonas sp. UWO 241]|nr:hypothetical protein FOA52_012354 [Chlamydomonas sp. UWO 241]
MDNAGESHLTDFGACAYHANQSYFIEAGLKTQVGIRETCMWEVDDFKPPVVADAAGNTPTLKFGFEVGNCLNCMDRTYQYTNIPGGGDQPINTSKPKLKQGGNLVLWQTKMTAVLNATHLAGALKQPGTRATAAEAEMDAEVNAAAMLDILESLDESIQMIMMEEKTAFSIVLTQRESATEYINRVHLMSKRLANAGVKLDPVLLVSVVLRGLPEPYSPFKVAMRASQTADYSLQTLNLLLTRAEADIQLAAKEGDRPIKFGTAMAVVHGDETAAKAMADRCFACVFNPNVYNSWGCNYCYEADFLAGKEGRGTVDTGACTDCVMSNPYKDKVGSYNWACAECANIADGDLKKLCIACIMTPAMDAGYVVDPETTYTDPSEYDNYVATYAAKLGDTEWVGNASEIVCSCVDMAKASTWTVGQLSDWYTSLCPECTAMQKRRNITWSAGLDAHDPRPSFMAVHVDQSVPDGYRVIDVCSDQLGGNNATAPDVDPIHDADFLAGDAGYTATNQSSAPNVWAYESGQWQVTGEDAGGSLQRLEGPPFVVTTAGQYTLALIHRYYFEDDGYDAGYVYVIINDVPSIVDFGSEYKSIENGQPNGFTGGPTVFSASTAVLSQSLSVNDTVSIRFDGYWSHGGFGGTNIQWEIKSVLVIPGVIPAAAIARNLGINGEQMAELVQALTAVPVEDGASGCISATGEGLDGGFATTDAAVSLYCGFELGVTRNCQVATRVGEDPPPFMLIHLDNFVYDRDQTGDGCVSCMRDFNGETGKDKYTYACEQY